MRLHPLPAPIIESLTCQLLRGQGASLKIIHLCSFYWAKAFRYSPAASVLLLSSGLLGLASLVAFIYLSERREMLESALKQALQREKILSTAPPKPVANSIPNLPSFSSADFTLVFHSLMRAVGIETGEVSYSLEMSPAQPYWRYRISLEVESGYSPIRTLLAALDSELPNVTLDSIRCTRESAALGLRCQLALSAFFRKPSDG